MQQLVCGNAQFEQSVRGAVCASNQVIHLFGSDFLPEAPLVATADRWRVDEEVPARIAENGIQARNLTAPGPARTRVSRARQTLNW